MKITSLLLSVAPKVSRCLEVVGKCFIGSTSYVTNKALLGIHVGHPEPTCKSRSLSYGLRRDNKQKKEFQMGYHPSSAYNKDVPDKSTKSTHTPRLNDYRFLSPPSSFFFPSDLRDFFILALKYVCGSQIIHILSMTPHGHRDARTHPHNK
jgi:hypothetical protein